ncbi:MAG: trehalose-6-phosphate synthase [Vicinamibacteraceae bacterium]|nr:trehalose-6-phosphate synthase [Vicinamibacteraceae bacterium]
MRRLFALAAIVVAMAALRQASPEAVSPFYHLPLAVGFTLLAATVIGDAVARVGLPRITGYLLFGIVCGPSVADLVSREMARDLQVVNGAAVALIGLIGGLELRWSRLAPRLAQTTRFTLALVLVLYGGLALLLGLAWPWLPIHPEASPPVRWALASLLAAAVATFSPVVSVAVVAEQRARGRLTDVVLSTTILGDLALVAVFSLSLQALRWLLTPGAAGDLALLVEMAWLLVGSLAGGALVGAAFALYVTFVGRELTAVLLVLSLVGSQAARMLGLEPIFAGIAAGFVVGNVARGQGEVLRIAISKGSLPVLVVFFAAAGSALDLQALATMWPVVVGLVAARLLFLRLGTRLASRAADIEPEIAPLVWRGLFSQAGITLGLGAVIASEFLGWGTRVQALAVALVAVHETVGPVLFRNALRRAGEHAPARGKPLIVASNREPYVHTYRDDGSVYCPATAGGVAVALDALMRQRGGVWVAHGAGTADRAVVDERDHVLVPPDAPSYTLRRLWIDEPDFSRYYGGLANEGLWPLCHVVDVRPIFREADWVAYRRVNAQFAAAIHQEMANPATLVFIQDYHLALVAAELRARRPDARTAIFWHIPWPSPDRLRVCPWRRELLLGLLANDLVAFQTERDRRNYVMATLDELGDDVSANGPYVSLGRHDCAVVSVPIGIDFDRIQDIVADPATEVERQRLVERFGLRGQIVGVGVDRLDYTKGIPERLAALDRLLTRRKELRGTLTFVQVGVPSRSELGSYSAIETEIDRAVERINRRHAVEGGAVPVVYHKSALPVQSLVPLFRMARFCVVSSLHDGMNLVAKEFVASRDDLKGVLVLSEFAGAAQELGDAIIVNPYDIEGFAAALGRAIDMPAVDQERRMRTMRRIVAGRDVFNWASDILEGLESLGRRPLLFPPPEEPAAPAVADRSIA